VLFHHYLFIMVKAVDDNDAEKEEKIIRNISKNVVVEK
jgi:hypothetical protein